MWDLMGISPITPHIAPRGYHTHHRSTTAPPAPRTHTPATIRGGVPHVRTDSGIDRPGRCRRADRQRPRLARGARGPRRPGRRGAAARRGLRGRRARRAAGRRGAHLGLAACARRRGRRRAGGDGGRHRPDAARSHAAGDGGGARLPRRRHRRGDARRLDRRCPDGDAVARGRRGARAHADPQPARAASAARRRTSRWCCRCWRTPSPSCARPPRNARPPARTPADRADGPR